MNTNHLNLFLIKRWQFCCLLFFVMSCHIQQQQSTTNEIRRESLAEEKNIDIAIKHIREAQVFVESGDLILRTGKDYTSELIKNISQKDKTFSHCGIASWENDTLFVYHALGGEFNPDQKLRRDPFMLFCNPYENRGFGVYRYKINKNQEKSMIAIARKYYQEGVKFDMQFDLATDDRMYCSEFVYKTIKKATHDSVALGTTTLHHIQFVAVDNLFVNRFCREIKRVFFVNNQ